jgi:hypothetical protein
MSLKPKQKGLYAWNAIHAGSFLLYIEKLKDCYKFMFLPGPSPFFLTFEDFEKCINSSTLEFVEVLPNDIYEESVNIFLSCPEAKTIM